jgi:selT/selW/selH-like putative selenoprotein
VLGVKPELLKGSNGIFDVAVDGAIVFSRHREGRYPEAAQIIDELRRRGL